MRQVPKGVWFSVGVSLWLVVAAAIAARAPAPDAGAAFEDSCFRYGRFECCVRGDDAR